MSEAAAQPPPEPPRDIAGLVQYAAGLVAENTATTRQAVQILARIEQALAVRGDPAELASLANALVIAAHRQAEQGADIRPLPGAMRDAALIDAAGITAPLAAVPGPAPGAAPRKARHRAQRNPAQRPLFPRAIRGVVPAGGLVAMLRHSWAAHPVATAATGFTAATLMIGGGGAAVHAATSPGAARGSTPNPAASVVAAAPMLQPVTSASPRFPSAVTKPKTDADRSAPLATLPPPALPLPAISLPGVSPVQGPGDAQDPLPQLPVQGTLSVSAAALDLTGSGTGQITLSCTGGDCPWRVVAGGAVSADVRHGYLADGETTTVTLSVGADALLAGGSGVVTVRPGHIRVAVSWAAPALPSAPPTVDPSAAAGILPSLPAVP